MRQALFVTLLAAFLQDGSRAGVQVWKATDIQQRGRVLATKLDDIKVASETIATAGNRTFMVAHREGTGIAELHDAHADIIMISSGRVTMVYGGEVVDGKVTAKGEVRGPSIRGGTSVTLGPGDVLHIPAKTPHQMKLGAGDTVTYFVVKVVE